MVKRAITVRPVLYDDHAPAALLLTRQFARQQHASPVPLYTRNLSEIAELVRHQCLHHAPLVAVNAQGAIRGYVLPDLWTLANHSLLRAFLTARNGIACALTLPDPQDKDADEVADMLLSALSHYWQKLGATGDLIRWPSGDRWLEPVLKAHGFLIDSICAFYPPVPLTIEQKASWYTIRPVLPADEEAVVALFREELIFQLELGLFARVNTEILAAFRAKLVRSFSATQEDAPLVLVAETAGRIIAMAECTIIQVYADDEPGFTIPGSYGCIDNVCVGAQARGQGIGRVLVKMAMQLLRPKAQNGYLLWYSADNPRAAHFWSRMGFKQQWTTYQRLRREPDPPHS